MPSSLLITAIVLLVIGYCLHKSAGEVIRANPYPHDKSPESLAAGRRASIAVVINVIGLITLFICFIRWAF